MPVKITKQVGNSDPNDPRVISLQEYLDGRANFDMHYFHSASALPFGGKDFSILWDDLSNAVDTFIVSSGVPMETVCLRYVHCFDLANTELYMRLQICTMYPTPITDHGKQLYALDTTNQAWYELRQGCFAPTPDDTLIGNVYFNNFYYAPMEGAETLQPLVTGITDKFVKNIVFPWQAEILQMYLDNSSPAGAFINFGACSYTHNNPGDESVEWPHGLVMYLSDAAGSPLLDNESSICIFHNKGADLGTLCPPICDGYLMPNV